MSFEPPRQSPATVTSSSSGANRSSAQQMSDACRRRPRCRWRLTLRSATTSTPARPMPSTERSESSRSSTRRTATTRRASRSARRYSRLAGRTEPKSSTGRIPDPGTPAAWNRTISSCRSSSPGERRTSVRSSVPCRRVRTASRAIPGASLHRSRITRGVRHESPVRSATLGTAGAGRAAARRWLDESVLVFRQPSLADAVPWAGHPARRAPRLSERCRRGRAWTVAARPGPFGFSRRRQRARARAGRRPTTPRGTRRRHGRTSRRPARRRTPGAG